MTATLQERTSLGAAVGVYSTNAFQAVWACCALAQEIGLEGSEAFRAVAGIRLVLGTGRAALEQHCIQLASSSGGSDADADDCFALGEAVETQVNALQAAIGIFESSGGSGAACAAFAATSAPRIAPWLTTVSRTLLLLDSHPGGHSLVMHGSLHVDR